MFALRAQADETSALPAITALAARRAKHAQVLAGHDFDFAPLFALRAQADETSALPAITGQTIQAERVPNRQIVAIRFKGMSPTPC